MTAFLIITITYLQDYVQPYNYISNYRSANTTVTLVTGKEEQGKAVVAIHYMVKGV